MAPFVVEAVKIVAYSAAAAVSVLLVGGAVKKVINDPGDDCLEAGKNLARSLVNSVPTLALEGSGAKALPSA